MLLLISYRFVLNFHDLEMKSCSYVYVCVYLWVCVQFVSILPGVDIFMSDMKRCQDKPKVADQ